MVTREATRLYHVISNNHALFHLWWKECLVKHQKVSKYYPIDCSKESKQSYLTLTTSWTFIYTFLVHPCLLSIILTFAPHFDWWLRFHIVILVWLLQYGSVVCKFQFQKHYFSCKHASVNLSTNLPRFYMWRFHLSQPMFCTSIFNLSWLKVDFQQVSNTCSFVQFCWPRIIRCRNIKKKINLLI